jgi:hypothetical protein
MPELDDLLSESDNDSDLVKSLRKALRDANKQKGELERTLAERAKGDRTRQLADILRDKGVPEKAAKYFPADTDPTPEAVDKWIEEDGDLFGIVAQGTNVPPEVKDSAQRITQAKNPEELAAVYAKAGMVNPG